MTPNSATLIRAQKRKQKSSDTSDYFWNPNMNVQWFGTNAVVGDIQESDSPSKTGDYRELIPRSLGNGTDYFGEIHDGLVYFRDDDPRTGSTSVHIERKAGNPGFVVELDDVGPITPMIYMPTVEGRAFKENETIPESPWTNFERNLPEWSATIDRAELELEFEDYIIGLIKRAFFEAEDELFVDGMESAFSATIHTAIWVYGDAVVSAITTVIRQKPASVEVIGEVLRQIGSVRNHQSHDSRLRLLIQQLESSDPRIRDAASLGIADLDDTAAIPIIRKAIERETSPVLRKNLNLVLQQLRATEGGEFS